MDMHQTHPADGMTAAPDLLGFSAMAKPAAAACNLACRYCYYLRRPGAQPSRRMRHDVLEAYIRDTIAAQRGAPELVFAWQGGEPTLAGIGFFEEAVTLQKRYRPADMRIANALQTNGTLLDDDWAAFLREQGFLVGVSIDGPARFHDPLRRDADGGPTHARAMRALALLQRHGVEFNTLTVVHNLNWRHGREVYRFLRRVGSRHMQFIPLVERTAPDGGLAGPPPDLPRAGMAPWTPPPHGFGQFLCDAFDDCRARDIGQVFVQLFEEHAAALAGLPARLCVFAPECSGTPMLEANGDLYSCDHYAYPAYRLGNILETPIGKLARSERQGQFGHAKTASLPEACCGCRFLAACFGGCPKHRFTPAAAGGPPPRGAGPPRPPVPPPPPGAPRRRITFAPRTVDSSRTRRRRWRDFPGRPAQPDGRAIARSVFHRDRVERPPQVPGGHRAPGPQGLAAPPHGPERDPPAAGGREPQALLQAEVAERKHIRAQQIEDQEHLRGPAADAAHLGEILDDRLVVHGRPFVHVHLAVGKTARKVGDVFAFPLRQSACPEVPGFRFQNFLW